MRDRSAREASRRCWIEGPRLVGEYVARHGSPLNLIVQASVQQDPEVARLVIAAKRAPTIVSDALFGYISDVVTPSGIGAEIEIPPQDTEPRRAGACVLLETVQDPGNVGAILRSAVAFGIAEVRLTRDCADPWSPKVLRAGAGAQFALQLPVCDDPSAYAGSFAGKRLCAIPRGGLPPSSIDLRGPVLWMLGSEGRGVSEALQNLATHRVTIPMQAGSESLNVAIAAAVCFYEAMRQSAPEVCDAQ